MEQAMRRAIQLVLVGALLAVVVGAGLTALWRGPETREWWSGDSITRARIDTERKLANFRRSRDHGALREWLAAYHGEAPSHEVLITFGRWARSNQAEFLELLGGFELPERRTILWRLDFALSDSGQSDSFWRAFSGRQSPVLDDLRRSHLYFPREASPQYP
jgi:hypothetical protein